MTMPSSDSAGFAPLAGARAVDARNLQFAEEWIVEENALVSARARAAEIGVTPIGPVAGALLRFFAAVVSAKTVVEVGTGTGVSGLWLLRGMRTDGVLTSIDVEPEHQRLARQALREAGVAANRVRLIAGRAREVLPRLADRAYDLVHVDTHPTEYADLLPEALRLLRPGGIVTFSAVVPSGQADDARDPQTTALRSFLEAVHSEGTAPAVLIPAGTGLLALLHE